MPDLYPLEFQPLFRRYLWGGRRLATVLGKPLGDGEDYAESWEVVDHGDDQSIVASGPLKGRTLASLVASHGAELFGRHHPQTRFPLLFKFLDAHRNLSVQVHPDDAAAQRLDPPDLGKTEAWVVLHADAGSRIYAGLKRGVDRGVLDREVHRGATEPCLHWFEPRAGDCVFIPAGAVHALGEGLVVAEIQQASDTTFRLFDWNRLGADGRPRTLHVAAALEAIDYDAGPVDPRVPEVMENRLTERLVACDKFVLDRHRLTDAMTLGGDRRFHILTVLEGTCTLRSDCGIRPWDEGRQLEKGATVLLPASEPSVGVEPCEHALLLDMYLP